MSLPQPSIEDVLQDIPDEYRERFEALLGKPPETPQTLASQVDAYIRTVRQVGPLVAFIDVAEAERITAALLGLIALLPPQPSDTSRVVQAAVHYFVLEEDDEEVTGVLGFDDDIQVVNAVCRAVRRDDLVVPLKRHPL